MNRWVGLGLLSAALTGCASGPFAVPETKFVTVPPKVHVKYIVKPAPTVTVTTHEKLPEVCVLAIRSTEDLGKALAKINGITDEIKGIAAELPVQAFGNDHAGMNKSQSDLNRLYLDLGIANTEYNTAKATFDKANKQCAKEDVEP